MQHAQQNSQYYYQDSPGHPDQYPSQHYDSYAAQQGQHYDPYAQPQQMQQSQPYHASDPYAAQQHVEESTNLYEHGGNHGGRGAQGETAQHYDQYAAQPQQQQYASEGTTSYQNGGNYDEDYGRGAHGQIPQQYDQYAAQPQQPLYASEPTNLYENGGKYGGRAQGQSPPEMSAAAAMGLPEGSKPAYSPPSGSQYGGRNQGQNSSATLNADATGLPAGSKPAYSKPAYTSPSTNHQTTTSTYDPDSKRRTRTCFCFPTRRSCCLTFLAIFVIILIVLGVLVWYFWPTIPQFGNSDAYDPTPAQTALIQQNLPKDKDAIWKPGPSLPTDPTTILTSSTLALAYGLGIDFWLNNAKNRFAIELDRLKVVGRLRSVDGQTFLDTKLVNLTIHMINLNFPKDTNTTIHVPLYLQYESPLSALLKEKDPFLQLLSTSCQQPFLNLQPAPNKIPLTMEFDMDVAPKVLKRLGISIKKTVGPFSIDCPPSLMTGLQQVNSITQNIVNGPLGGILPKSVNAKRRDGGE